MSCGNTEVKREQICLALFFVPLVLKGLNRHYTLTLIRISLNWKKKSEAMGCRTVCSCSLSLVPREFSLTILRHQIVEMAKGVSSCLQGGLLTVLMRLRGICLETTQERVTSFILTPNGLHSVESLDNMACFSKESSLP